MGEEGKRVGGTNRLLSAAAPASTLSTAVPATDLGDIADITDVHPDRRHRGEIALEQPLAHLGAGALPRLRHRSIDQHSGQY